MAIKTILIPLSSGFFVRNFLRSDVFEILHNSMNLRLVFLAPEDKITFYQREFNFKNVIFDFLPLRKNLLSERFFIFFERMSIHSRRVLMEQRRALKFSGSVLGIAKKIFIFLVSRLFWFMGQFGFWRKLIRATYFLIPSNFFGGTFKKYNPDLVFCPTMVHSDNYILLREARKKSIKSIGMIFSWDNLYSKTLLRLHPGRLVVQSDVIKDQAIKTGDYPTEKIIVTGIPQYDAYFKKEGVIDRSEFIRTIGGDPSRKLIVYACSAKSALDIDFEMINILNRIVEEKKIDEPVQILIRPYPRYNFPKETAESLKNKYGFLLEPPISKISKGKEGWEFDEQAIFLLTNTLAHADIVITVYSTFFIEGAVFDKPLIGIAFDGSRKVNYWNSARRFFDWDHLAGIKSLNGIWLAKGEGELVEAINSYLSNPKQLSEGRKKIVVQQCQFTDGNAGQRLAEAVLSELKK